MTIEFKVTGANSDAKEYAATIGGPLGMKKEECTPALKQAVNFAKEIGITDARLEAIPAIVRQAAEHAGMPIWEYLITTANLTASRNLSRDIKIDPTVDRIMEMIDAIIDHNESCGDPAKMVPITVGVLNGKKGAEKSQFASTYPANFRVKAAKATVQSTVKSQADRIAKHHAEMGIDPLTHLANIANQNKAAAAKAPPPVEAVEAPKPKRAPRKKAE